MAKGVVFSRDAAGRIGAAVRRVEKTPLGDQVIRSRHKPRGGSGGTALYWAKLTAKINDTTYTADIFDDRGEGAIETAIAVRVHDLAAGETITLLTYWPVAMENWTGTGYWTIKQQIGLF